MPGTVNFKDFKDTVERWGDVKTVDSKYLDQFTDASGDMDPQLKDYFESQWVMWEIADAVNITDNLNLREYIKSIPAEALADTHQLALYLRSTIDGVTFWGKPCVDKELIQITYNNGQKKAFSKQELISHYKDLGHTVKSRADAEALLIQWKGRDPKGYPNHTKSYKTIEGGSTYVQEWLEAIMVLIKLGLKEEGFYTGKIDGKITQNFTSACWKAQNGAWASEIQKYQNTSTKVDSKTSAKSNSKAISKEQPASTNWHIEVEMWDVATTQITNNAAPWAKITTTGVKSGIEVEIWGATPTANNIITWKNREVITSQTATVVDVEKKTSWQKIWWVSVEANMIKDWVELVMDGGKKIIIIDKSFTKDTPALVTFGQEEHNVYFNEEGRLITKKSASQPKQKTTQKAKSKTDKLTNKLNGKVDNSKVIEKKTPLPTVESELITKEAARRKSEEMQSLISNSFKELTAESMKKELKLWAFLGWWGDKKQRKELEQGLQDVKKEANELETHEDKLSFYQQVLKAMHDKPSVVYAGWKVERVGENLLVKWELWEADRLDSKEAALWKGHIKKVQSSFENKVKRRQSPAYTWDVTLDSYEQSEEIKEKQEKYSEAKKEYLEAVERRIQVEEKISDMIDKKNTLIEKIEDNERQIKNVEDDSTQRGEQTKMLLADRKELTDIYIDLYGEQIVDRELGWLNKQQRITKDVIAKRMQDTTSLVDQHAAALKWENETRKTKDKNLAEYTVAVEEETAKQNDVQWRQSTINDWVYKQESAKLTLFRKQITLWVATKKQELKKQVDLVDSRVKNGSYADWWTKTDWLTPSELLDKDFAKREKIIQDINSLEKTNREKLGEEHLIDQKKVYSEQVQHQLAKEISDLNIALYSWLLEEADAELKLTQKRIENVTKRIDELSASVTVDGLDKKLVSSLLDELKELDTLESNLSEKVDSYTWKRDEYIQRSEEIQEYVEYSQTTIDYIEAKSNMESVLSVQEVRVEELSFLQDKVESHLLENHGLEKEYVLLLAKQEELLKWDVRERDMNALEAINKDVKNIESNILSNEWLIQSYMTEWNTLYGLFTKDHARVLEMDKVVKKYESELEKSNPVGKPHESYCDGTCTDFTQTKTKLSADDYVSDQQLLDYDEFKKNGLAEYSQKEIEKTDPTLESTLPSSIALGYVDKAVSPTPSLKIDKVKNMPRLQRYASVVERELAKPEYQSVLENFDIAINLSGSIKNNGIENAWRIIAWKDIFLNIDYNSITEMKFSRTLHHEIFTALLKQSGKYDTALDDISKLNTEDFDYSSEFKGKYKDADETMLTEWFVSEYAKTTPSNDLSEIAEFLLSGEKLHRANWKTLKQVAQQKEKYPVLSKKVALVQKILTDLKTPAANEVNNNS